jgi:aldose 1-epimerase
VSADGLRCDQEVTNASDANAPWGYSVHPYVQLTGVSVDDTVLRVPGRVRVLADTRLLPIGAVKVAGTEYDFTEPRRIGDAVLDTTFGDLDHEPDGGSSVTVAAPSGDPSVTVWADSAFKWWQVFTGDTLHGERHRRSVAIEPMTCPPDAFRSGRDVIVLEPGQNWSASWGIRP